MNKLLTKLTAVLLLIFMMSANVCTPIAYALSESEISSQNSKTQNSNVEFNTYFEGGAHSKTEEINNSATLFANIKVKNAGYIENATISFENVNFKISEEIKNESVQSVDTKENKIILNKINSGSDVTIEIPISILNSDQVSIDNFEKETITKFNAKYIDGNGKEKTISKDVTNKLLWNGTAESTLETELTKYVPYSVNEKYGVLLQAKIKSGVKESKLPIKNTQIDIQVPEINGVKPTSVNVVANQTKATNGETNDINFNSQNYTYDTTSGKVTINTSNNQNQISWLKNVQDEYLVNLIFDGREIYDYVKANGLNTKTTAESKIELYGLNSAVTNNSTIEMNENEAKGTITDFSILSVQYINKGQIYANYSANDNNKKETAYAVRYVAQINNAELTENVKFVQEIDSFATSTDTKNATTVAGNNYAYNKNIKINQKMFQKILGEDGSIEIYNNINNEKIATINKDTQVSDEYYVLDISNQNNNQLTITTSKPISEGTIEIDIEKAIKTNIDYSKNQFNNFKSLIAEVKGNAENTNTTKSIKVNFREPITTAELSVNKTNLSTVVEKNNIELRAVLNTLNANNALYKNPTIEIQLPSQIKKATIKDIDLLLEDELKIKNYSVNTQNGKQVIVVELQGEQTKYFSADNITKDNIIAKGANIIINVDLELDRFAASKNEKINMYYTNQNSNLFEETAQLKTRATNTRGLTATDVNIVAPTEVTTTNQISGYDSTGSTKTNLEDSILDVMIPANSAKREATITGTITNNDESNIANVFILGRLPFAGNQKIDDTIDLESTFDMPLQSNITVSGIESSKVKIYYSTNGEATKDLINSENNWTETPTDLTKVKSYLIALGGDITKGTQITFSYKAEIPANLVYDNSSSFGYKVYYDSKTETATIGTTKTAGFIRLYTGETANVTAEITTNMNQKDNQYFIGNNLTSRFFATIKNTSKMDAENVKVKVNLPENVTLVAYNETNGEFDNLNNPITISSIKAGQTVNIEYELQPDIKKKADFNREKKVSVEVSAENMQAPVNSNEIKFVVTDSDFEKLTNKVSTIESAVYSSNTEVEYQISIKPGQKINNVKVHIPLPTSSEIKSAYWDAFNSVEAKVTRTAEEAIIELDSMDNTATNTLYFNFILKDVVAKYSTKIYVEADGIEKQYSNERYIYMQSSGISGEQLKTNKVYVKEQEEFEYKFNINTTGGAQNNIVFKDQLPDGVQFKNGSVTIECTDLPNYEGTEHIKYDKSSNTVTITINTLPTQAKISITLKVAGTLNADEKNGRQVTNKATVQSLQTPVIELNSVSNYIEYVSSAHTNPNTGEAEDPNNPDNPNQNNRYKITGTAWVDSNKNGEREENEELLSGVNVMLIYKNNSAVVKDVDTGERKVTTTAANGTYEFSNLRADEYLVVFLYDSGKYSITEYQKKDVGESYNSDAINTQVTLEGKITNAGVTDTIKLSNGNARDIDIGLYVAEKFDLKLDKYISKITLTTPTIGTKVNEYANSQLEKIEVLKQNIGKSNIIVEYKIVVTNEGQVPGYVKKVIDYLPTDAKFNTEINKNWYKADNNKTVFNASLAETEIKPGESKEVTLVLSYNITDKNIGTIINNNAEIYESYNKLGLSDIDSKEANMLEQEDDMSKADIILSVATGRIMLNIGIIIAVVAMLVVGIYEIKKRVLK